MNNSYSIGFLDDRLDSQDTIDELLPLFHSCDAYWARAIIGERKIKPLFCKVFNEDLAYLFYGRPAYKKSTEESSKMNSLFPVSFILTNAGIRRIKRVAPFDTGAFDNKLYKEFMHQGMRIENFLLSPDIKVIPKFIHFFFGTNTAYFDGEPKSTVNIDNMDFEIESYFELIKAGWTNKADDRKATIEIQVDEELVITKNIVEAIVIPSHFRSSKFVQEVVIKEWEAEVITYKSYGVPSNNNYTLLLHLVREYLIKKAYLNEVK